MEMLFCGFAPCDSCAEKSEFKSESVSFLSSPLWSKDISRWNPENVKIVTTLDLVILLNEETSAVIIDGRFSSSGQQQFIEIAKHGMRDVHSSGLYVDFIDLKGNVQRFDSREVHDTTPRIRNSESKICVQKVVSVISGASERGEMYFLDQNSHVLSYKPSGEFSGFLNFDSEEVVDMVAGREHVLFLTRSGKVWACGLSSRGQLGNGSLDPVAEPEVIPALTDCRIIQIAAGGWSSRALSESGIVFVWGWNSAGALGFPNRAVREKSSPSDENEKDSRPEEFIELLAEPRCLPFPEKISWISCGMRHAGAVSVSGRVYLWGLNQHGQLGTGDRSDRDCPVLLTYSVSHPAFRLFCVNWSTMLIFQDAEPETNFSSS